jgi:phosphoribosyl-ATP pyrophosphohydrolase
MADLSIMSALMGVIHQRRSSEPSEPSYVATLMRGGLAKIGAKIVEEAAEVVEAGGEPGEEGRVHLTREVADLVFHTMVLLGYRELDWSDVESELAQRFGTSGITEKQSRRSNRAPDHNPPE